MLLIAGYGRVVKGVGLVGGQHLRRIWGHSNHCQVGELAFLLLGPTAQFYLEHNKKGKVISQGQDLFTRCCC